MEFLKVGKYLPTYSPRFGTTKRNSSRAAPIYKFGFYYTYLPSGHRQGPTEEDPSDESDGWLNRSEKRKGT